MELQNKIPRKYAIPVNQLFGGLITRGSVNSKQHCEICGSKFTPLNQDNDGFYCPTDRTRPTRYYVDAKAFGLNLLYKDPNTGRVLKTYGEAIAVLVALNHIAPDGRLKKDEWMPEKIKERRMENLCPKWLRNYTVERDKGAKSHTRVHHLTTFCDSFIVPFFKGYDIRDIDRDAIENFFHYLLDKKFSTRYIKDILDTLKSLLLRYRPGDIPDFPFFTVVPAREKQILGLAREMAVVEHVPERHGYRLAILLLLRTGMRLNEVIALQAHDLADGIVRVSKAISDGKLRLARKSGKPVNYRVTTELWSMLIDHVQGKHPDDFVFNIDGKPFGADRLPKVWVKACTDAGQKHISLQQASRHSTATGIMREYIERGLREVQKQLGHENIWTGKNHYIVE